MSWLDAFSGAAGGAFDALGNIRRQRQVDVEQQLRDRQMQEQVRANRVREFGTKFDALHPDADVDPALLQEAATLGFSSMFKRTPDGRVRRQETLSDQIQKLQFSTQDVLNQTSKHELDFLRQKTDPQTYAKLLAMPREERKAVALRLGIDPDDTRTEQEKREDAETTLQTNPTYRSYKDMLRLANQQPRAGTGKSGLNQNQILLRATQMAIRTAEKDSHGRIDPISYEAELARHIQSVQNGDVFEADYAPPVKQEDPGFWGSVGNYLKGFIPGAAPQSAPAGAPQSSTVPPTAGGNTKSLAEVEQIAKAEGMSVQQVIQYFQSKGINVVR